METIKSFKKGDFLPINFNNNLLFKLLVKIFFITKPRY